MGPGLGARHGRATGRIAAFHACDWLVPTTDLVFDRGMMGDGCIDIPAIRGMAEAAGVSWLRRGGAAVEALVGGSPDDVLRDQGAARDGVLKRRRPVPRPYSVTARVSSVLRL